MPAFNQSPYYSPSPVFVLGVDEARSYPVLPNTTAILLDRNEPVFYLKSVDQSGFTCNFKIFDYVERQPKKPEANFVTRDEFNELKQMLEDLTAPSKN